MTNGKTRFHTRLSIVQCLNQPARTHDPFPVYSCGNRLKEVKKPPVELTIVKSKGLGVRGSWSPDS